MNSRNTYLKNHSGNTSSTAVVSQFERWASEQESFELKTQQTNRERVKVEEGLLVIKQEIQQVSKELRDCQNSLGQYHKERSNLQQQIDHYKALQKRERNELEQLMNESHDLIQHENKIKQGFCLAMNDLNQELSDILWQQEALRLEKLITTDTVVLLQDHYHQRERKTSNHVGTSHDSSVLVSPDTPKNDTNMEGIRNELDKSIKELLSVDQLYNEIQLEQKRIQSSLEMFRTKTIQEQGMGPFGKSKKSIITKNELLVLEEKWKENLHPGHGNNIQQQLNNDHTNSDYIPTGGNVDDHIHPFYDDPERNERSFDEPMDE